MATYTRILCLVLWLTIPLALFAQSPLTGRVLGENRQPVQLCNVLALRADSTLVGGVVTDASGAFTLPITDSTALVRFAYVGYAEQTLPVAQVPGEVVLLPVSVEIGQASVQGTRPQLRMVEAGLIELPVKGTSLAAKADITDLLRQLPGFVASGDEGVRMVNGGSHLIYLNGRKVQSFDEIRNLDPANVKSLKLNTAPGAKYGSGTNAVIMIETKANLQGLSLYARVYTRRRSVWNYGGNVSLSYTPGRVTYYGELSYDDFRAKREKTFRADFTEGQDAVDKARLESTVNEYETTRTPRVKLGIEAQPAQGLNLGARYSASYAQMKFPSHEHHIANRNGAVIDNLDAEGNIRQTTPIHQVNAYGRYQITERLGATLNADFYLKGIDKPSDHKELSNTTHAEYAYRQHNKANYLLWQVTPSVDYSFGQRGQLEVGGELYQITGDGKVDRGGVTVMDYSNHEQQYAGFATYAIPLGNWNASVGARYEYSSSQVDNWLTPSKSENRHYAAPFFSASLAGVLGPTKHSFSLASFSRQPSLQLLANNDYRSSNYLYQESNPLLRPTHYYRAGYTFMWQIFYLGLEYSYAKDFLFYTFVPNPAVQNGYIIRPENFESAHTFKATLYAQLPLTSWYTIKGTGLCMVDRVDASKYGGKTLPVRPLLYGKVENEFNFPHDFFLSADYEYTSSSNAQIFTSSSTHSVNLYFGKWFMKRSLYLSAAAVDIFALTEQTHSAELRGLRFTMGEWQDSRYVQLRIIYRFNKVKDYSGKATAKEAIERL